MNRQKASLVLIMVLGVILLGHVALGQVCDPKIVAASCSVGCCGSVSCTCSVACPVNGTTTSACMDSGNFSSACSYFACTSAALSKLSGCASSNEYTFLNASLSLCTTLSSAAGCSVVQYDAALQCLAALACRSDSNARCTVGCYAQSLSCFVDVGCTTSANYCQNVLKGELAACSTGFPCATSGTCSSSHVARCASAQNLIGLSASTSSPSSGVSPSSSSINSGTTTALIILGVGFAVILVLFIVILLLGARYYSNQKDEVRPLSPDQRSVGGAPGTQIYNEGGEVVTVESGGTFQSAPLSAQPSYTTNRSPSEIHVPRLSVSNKKQKRAAAIVFQLRQGLWQKGRLIGRGANGSVYQCVLNDGSFVALKQIDMSSASPQDSDAFCQELRLMSTLRHDHIIRYYYAELDTQEKCVNLWMEFMHGGSLSALSQKLDDRLNESCARRYVRQIVKGLAFLHEHHVIHRDIKGDNILIESEGVVKLADFGSAKYVEGGVTMNRYGAGMSIMSGGATYRGATDSIVGTPLWMAPEVVNPERHNGATGYTSRCDIWSLGICVAELLNQGQPPFPSFASAWEAMLHIGNLTTPPDVPEASPLCTDFMKKCLSVDPKLRPTARALLQHPWISTVDEEDDEFEYMSEQASDEFRASIDRIERARADSLHSTGQLLRPST
jgi:serine/threonine protein kinase